MVAGREGAQVTLCSGPGIEVAGQFDDVQHPGQLERIVELKAVGPHADHFLAVWASIKSRHILPPKVMIT